MIIQKMEVTLSGKKIINVALPFLLLAFEISIAEYGPISRISMVIFPQKI